MEEVKIKKLKMKPTEWAKQDGIDHHLFLYWENDLMTKYEYKHLLKSLYKVKNIKYRGI